MTTRRSLVISLIGLAFTASLLAETQSPGSDRQRVFISDTHFGVGKTADGAWHPYEDFRWAPEWTLFLQEIDRRGGGKTDLILNGDTFELWQSVEQDCITPGDPGVGCTEPAALARLDRVVAAHREELRALGAFADRADNRVYLVPGNHDAALLFLSVGAAAVQALASARGHVQLVSTGSWTSPDGLIYAEHGHQIGAEVNKFSGWPAPFVQRPDGRHLQRPWGEQMVQQFYNQYEQRYPIVDNLASESLGIRYAIAAEGKRGTVAALGKFLMFEFWQTSRDQKVASLGLRGDGRPDYNLAKVRKQGDRFLVESLAADDPLRPALDASAREGSLDVHVKDLTDEDLCAICASRQRLIDAARRRGQPDPVKPCPVRSMGALRQGITTPRHTVFARHLAALKKQLESAGAPRPFQLFVFSHTHLAEAGFRPNAKSAWSPLVVNTGAWQRTADEAELAKLKDRYRLDNKRVLTLQPETLPASYSAVIVAPYAAEPVSQLLYWQREGGRWQFSTERGGLD